MILKNYKYINEPYYGFFRIDYQGGILIVLSILLSVITVNLGFSKYFYKLIEIPIKIGIGDKLISYNLKYWVNEFLMSIFFFLMGLALKREIIFFRSNFKKSIPIILTVFICFFIPYISIKLIFREFKINEILYVFSTDILIIMFILNLFSSKVTSDLKSYIISYSIIMNTLLLILIMKENGRDFNLYYFLIGISLFIYLVFFNIIKIKLTVIYVILAITIVVMLYKAGLNLSCTALFVALIIPANRKIRIKNFYNLINENLKLFTSKDEKKTFLTNEQIMAIDRMKIALDKVQGPLEYLEHSLHNFVIYFILPLFIFINTGTFFGNFRFNNYSNIIYLNVFTLFVKSLSFFLCIMILKLIKIENPFSGNFFKNIAISFISSAGFIVSIFILLHSSNNDLFVSFSKIGILITMFTSIFLGSIFMILSERKNNNKKF